VKTKIARYQNIHTLHLKILALCIGYGLWYILSQTNSATITVSVPLCFDNTQQTQTIEAPETVSVTLSGPRNELATLELDSLAIHLEISHLPLKKHTITLCSNNLHLPEQVNLIHYEPSPITLQINEQQIDNQEQQGGNG